MKEYVNPKTSNLESEEDDEDIKTLHDYYLLVKRTILDFQNPVTGLLPASLYRAQFVPEKDCSDSWIRDNVYSILAVWGLSLAYCKTVDYGEDKSRQYELEQSVVKLMRGLLTCMMQQVNKVEKFKKSQRREDSLHAKYSYNTCQVVVGDNDWGHLQIDSVALYLLILAQMITSGLQIIYTKDEVDFIQNLVFYIESAYRVPDFGVWERGDKTNRGMTELNASSVGMAKAALEAMNELDVFGSRGGVGSIIHVQADQIQYCKTVLHSMLPRESHSKECGSALLSIVSFPAFAVEDASIINTTKSEIVNRLQGVYGCKRFLRDGHHCENEDRLRLHYELHELSKFEHIECEWPLFFCFLILDGLYNNNMQQVKEYKALVERLVIPSEDDVLLLPELFYVQKDKIDAERERPHSQPRVCGDHIPHMWTQSLYILGRLLHDGYIAVGELDPLNKRYVTAPKPELVVQVALIAEDEEIKELLAENGIVSQTADEASPIRILPARCLSWIYGRLGKNKNLGLTGRPRSSIGVIEIGSLYRAAGNILTFAPQFLDYRQFYLCLDNDLLVDSFKTEIEYIRKNWRQVGRPTLTLPVTHSFLEDSMSSAAGKLLLQVSSGYLYSVRVRVGRLSDFLSRSSTKTLDFIDSDRLEELITLFPDPTLSPRPGEVLRNVPNRKFSRSRASHLKLWSLVRHTSGMLRKSVEGLGEVCTQLLVNQKQIGIGLPHLQREELIKQPLPPSELKELIYRCCGQDSSTAVLTQEILTYLAMFVKIDPGLFNEMLQIRVGLIMEVLAAEYARVSGLTGEDAADDLMNMSPFQMKSLLYFILSGKEFKVEQVGDQPVVVGLEAKRSINRLKKAVRKISVALNMLEHKHSNDDSASKARKTSSVSDSDDVLLSPTSSARKIGQWLRRRCLDGALNRVPRDFYTKIWHVLERSHGMTVSGYGFILEHKLTQENTSGEVKFALKVEEELNKILYPEYRQLVVEAMMVLSLILERDTKYSVNRMLKLDEIVTNANRIFLTQQKSENGDSNLCCAGNENDNVKESSKCGASCGICRYFYDSPPSGSYGTMTYMTHSVLQLLYSHLANSTEYYRPVSADVTYTCELLLRRRIDGEGLSDFCCK
ncbi:phosphorylase b kinase regulatory subunit alpha, liver isoform-like isoform X2 [Hydractinia symbiolongicarpus]|uniref:phosphorylase b kinase regulatory subunit alpha, liver isoform-like isoform X2 n=1 Tax=Hydractinia symbiolongicarpus TaxID=13093 RepID=UPI002549D9B0|nr:phosphorylase b kinase regulatory subunit alpha, liver isoform-like isoform X2 [Hydractinia symbiolongicarpus]